jgi:hypothetical protein
MFKVKSEKEHDLSLVFPLYSDRNDSLITGCVVVKAGLFRDFS